MVVAQEKESLFAFWKEVRFEGRERETDLWMHALLNQLSFFLVFFSFLFCFLSYLFLFFLLCFLLLLPKNMLYFRSPFTGHGKSLFIVPAVTKVLLFCPLTASVWSRCTCRPPEVCATHFCQTEASFSSFPTVAFLSYHDINALSLHSQGMHPTVPPQTCIFWVVYHPSRTYLPKEAWAGAANRSFPLSPPPNHTPFTSYLWPMAPPCPILAGYRPVVPGPCACFARASFSDMSKSLPTTHASAVIWRLFVCVS